MERQDYATYTPIKVKFKRAFRPELLAVALALMCVTGCGVRTIYVPHGTPVRLRETVKDVKVWVKDADGKAVAGKMDLPEGWYSLPMPEEE